MSDKKYLNRLLLSLFMFNSSLLFVGHFLFFHNYINSYHFYDFIFLFSLLAFFPIYYLYIKQVFYTGNNRQLLALHFVPAIIIATASFTLINIVAPEDFKRYFFKMSGVDELHTRLSDSLYFIYQLARGVHIIQVALYSLAIFIHLKVNREHLKNYFSDANANNTRVFFGINIFFLLFMIGSAAYTTIAGRNAFYNSPSMIIASGFVFSIVHLVICLHGVRQMPIDIKIPKESTLDVSGISQKAMQQIEHQLLLFFEKERPWLSPNLKIWDLAIQVGTNKTYLSKVFSQRLNSSFNDFVNKYRYEEACRLMKKDKNRKYSLQDISEQAGFGSEVSFARTVKKIAGLRPSELRDSLV